jgi:hypothetical protein
MKTTLVLAVLLAAATPAFGQYGPGPSSYKSGEQPDWRLAPNDCRWVLIQTPTGRITLRRPSCG